MKVPDLKYDDIAKRINRETKIHFIYKLIIFLIFIFIGLFITSISVLIGSFIVYFTVIYGIFSLSIGKDVRGFVSKWVKKLYSREIKDIEDHLSSVNRKASKDFLEDDD